MYCMRYLVNGAKTHIYGAKSCPYGAKSYPCGAKTYPGGANGKNEISAELCLPCNREEYILRLEEP